MSSSDPPKGKRERLLKAAKAKLLGKARSGEPAEPSLAANTQNALTTLTTNLTQDRPTCVPSQTSAASHYATIDHELDEFQDLWALALQRLPEKDREGLLVSDRTSQTNVLEQLSKEVRQQQQKFEADTFQFNFRGRRIIPREIADRVLTVLEICKQVGDVAVNFDPVHAALPWAGVRFLLQIAISEKQQRCELLLGIEKVLSMTGRYKVLEMLYLREHNLNQGQLNLQTALVATYTLVLKYLLKVKNIQAKGPIARGSQALFQNGELSSLFEAAKQHESGIDRAANACESLAAHADRGRSLETRNRVECLQDLLQDFKEPLERIRSGISYVYTQIEQSKQSEVLRWISSIAFEDDHYTARKDRTVNSGQWLLHDDRFQAWWKSESASIMWLHGLPGTGKTKLVSSVIDFVRPHRDEYSSMDPSVELTHHQADSAVAYFYCDRNREDHRDPRSILCSFVRQLSMSNDGSSLQSHSVATYEKHKASGFATSQLSYEQALAHLEILAQAPSQTFLILDALDECEDSTRTKLVQDLQALLPRCDHPIRIFISSRPNRDIKAELHEGLNRAIEATDNRHDICRYVGETITKPDGPISWRTKVSPKLRQRVFDELTQNAEGNFQWVTLQTRQLHTLSSIRDVESRLGKLPKTLTALYDEMYRKILDAEGCAPLIAERAFRWLMCSYKSMSPKALVDAVCQDPFTDAMDDVADIDIDFVLHACQNLITVDSSGKVCRFSHLSVQEFLEDHHFTHREAHELVATICLKRLIGLEASEPGNRSKLYKYAAMHWSLHVQRSHEAALGDLRIRSLLQRFLGSKEVTSPQYRSWLQIEYVKDADSRKFSIGANETFDIIDSFDLSHSLSPSERVSLPLAFFGLHQLLPDLWQSINVLDCNDSGMTLLALAAQGRHISTVETLIRAGVDVNSFGSGRYAQTALYTAVASKNLSITHKILAAGAEVNFCAPYRNTLLIPRGQSCSNALQIAARKGADTIVDLLLEAGAQINTVAGHFGTALQACCCSNSEKSSIIASKLLNAGADVNLQGGKYGNALQAASTKPRNEIIVKILLNAGADVNLQGGKYGNALQAASAGPGTETIVKTLLNAGADVNLQGGEYSNALNAASIRGNESIVKILLSVGADVNAQGGNYGNALEAALSLGGKAVVEVLLNAGADANVQGGHYYGNPLHKASCTGDEAVVKMLLNAGANANAQGGVYGNALGAAVASGHTNLIKTLLGEGADVNAQAGSYGNALEIAAFVDDTRAVHLLLDAGADIERIGRFGKPSSAAFMGGAFYIVRWFLASGTDTSTLEIDIEKWLELGPELYRTYDAPKAVKKLFQRPSRAIPIILERVNEWLEADANRVRPPLIVEPEGIERRMWLYMERGRTHLEKIEHRMMEVGEWNEESFDESSSMD